MIVVETTQPVHRPTTTSFESGELISLIRGAKHSSQGAALRCGPCLLVGCKLVYLEMIR